MIIIFVLYSRAYTEECVYVVSCRLLPLIPFSTRSIETKSKQQEEEEVAAAAAMAFIFLSFFRYLCERSKNMACEKWFDNNLLSMQT